MSELTYDELIRDLFPRLTGGIRWGLERTEALLASAGNPHHSFRSVHIGGTNGKGSVAATVAALLQRNGHNTGLYTSPHLCTFRERIQINGRAISEDALVAAAGRVWPKIRELSPSFFEATTCIGFLALAEAGVDTAVIEVGLGGRLDSTNVITPGVAVITNIAMDHSEYLGDSLDSIAREKAGIVKPGVPLVIAEEAAQRHAIFRQLARDALRPVAEPAGVSFDLSGTSFVHDGAPYKTRLIGAHQAMNAALAIETVASLGGPVAGEALGGIRWPGRMQVETLNDQTWVFDVAHNVAGVHALVASLQCLELPRPLALVVGILGDKDWQKMLPPLFAVADHAILTVPPSAPANRAWDPDAVLHEVAAARAEVLRGFNDALARAAVVAANGTVLVTGSFHTVGDALIVLDRTPFGSDLTLPRLTFSG